MISDNIRQFLQDLDAKLPNEFSSEIDDTLGLLADVTSDLVVAVEVAQPTAPAAKNVEYARADPRNKVSASDNPDRTEYVDVFPIHKGCADA